jgi:phosphoglycerol transferase MdoB-like AlkP superfamily enzyme
VRWKLLIITSLVAALLSAGGMYVFTYLSKTYPAAPNELPPLSLGLVVISLAVTALASVFVYRHTARRRKLQAALTALLSLILTVAAVFAIARIVFARAGEGARSRTADTTEGRA